MFSVAQKQHLASVLEKAILDLKHPEMPADRIHFHLHVDGAEDWSWADIYPNWTFDAMHIPSVNPFNERNSQQKR